MKGLSEDQLKGKYSEEVVELQRQLKTKDEILKSYRSDHGQLEVFFGQVTDCIEPVTPLPVVYQKKKGKGSEVVAVMQISDGHMGAVQVGSEIENFNEFNPDICRQRQINYAHKFINWVEMHRTSYNIHECAVLVTGDLISGDIHDELKITNAFPSPVQVVKAAEVLSEQMSLVCQIFDKVTVHFIAEDNHARLVKKPQAKEAGYNSLNYLVGYIAKQTLALHSNLEFNLYPMYEKVVKVSTRNYLISHGHGLQGWMGIPWYSIGRHVGKEAQARMSIIMDDFVKAKEIGFHKYVFGHWHTPFDHPLYSCCGAVQGTDAYDHKSGRHAEPSQTSWMVHPKWGEFDRINFNLNTP